MKHTTLPIASRVLACRDVDPPCEQRASTFCALHAALLETNELVDADPGERGDFFSAQTRCSPAAAVGQSDVGRLALLAVGAEELGHSRHTTSMP